MGLLFKKQAHYRQFEHQNKQYKTRDTQKPDGRSNATTPVVKIMARRSEHGHELQVPHRFHITFSKTILPGNAYEPAVNVLAER